MSILLLENATLLSDLYKFLPNAATATLVFSIINSGFN